MNKKEAYEFLDSHIESEILYSYYGDRKKFDEAMVSIKELVARDTYEEPEEYEDYDGVDEYGRQIMFRWHYCKACGNKVWPERENFCRICGKRITPEDKMHEKTNSKTYTFSPKR